MQGGACWPPTWNRLLGAEGTGGVQWERVIQNVCPTGTDVPADDGLKGSVCPQWAGRVAPWRGRIPWGVTTEATDRVAEGVGDGLDPGLCCHQPLTRDSGASGPTSDPLDPPLCQILLSDGQRIRDTGWGRACHGRTVTVQGARVLALECHPYLCPPPPPPGWGGGGEE